MSGRDIYIAIVVAAQKGVGLRLSADEVAALSDDEAVRKAALNGLEPDEWPEHRTGDAPNWLAIDPARERRPANLANQAPENASPSRSRRGLGE